MGAIIIGIMNMVRNTLIPRIGRSSNNAKPTPNATSNTTTVNANTKVTRNEVSVSGSLSRMR